MEMPAKPHAIVKPAQPQPFMYSLLDSFGRMFECIGGRTSGINRGDGLSDKGVEDDRQPDQVCG
jgi:hypothetical protein